MQDHKILEHERINLKKTCVTQTNLEERVVEKVSQMLQTQQQNHIPCTVNDLPLREIGFDAEIECRLEAMVQYNRRDCLLFFGLYGMEFGDCTEKIVQTAHAMGVNITAADVSISHRLQIRIRRRDEPRPIIAKFNRSVKYEVFESKRRLKESQNHNNVYVQEQLTKARSRALYRMKEAGIRVSTFESRILYTHDGKHGVINSLTELPSKLGWDRAKMKEIFAKYQSTTRFCPNGFKDNISICLLNVRGLNSEINLNEIQRVVSASDIVGLSETLTNVFDAEEFNEHETFTGTDKSKLKRLRGLAFLIRKRL